MSLLGTPLVVLLACATVLIPVATLVLWSRIRGPKVVRGGTRLLLLGAGQLATVMLVGVLANDYGQFYTSWSGLFGTPLTPPSVAVYGASVGPSRPRPGGHPDLASVGPARGRMRILGNTAWSTPAQWSTRGKVVSVSISGLRSGLSAPAYVYLPPQYFSKAYAHHLFPAVEVMTGYPGSALNLLSRMDYPGVALELVNKHHSVPMIYVMLSPTVDPPRDTECTNIPGGPQTEMFLGVELPSAVQHALRVEPGHWGAVGDSTGGYCAAKLAMLHTGTFAGGVSLSGYYHALNGGTAGDLFGGSLAQKHANDLRWLLQHRPAPATSLFVAISKLETNPSQGYPETMRFLKLVRPPMHVTALIEQDGGHNFATWDRELPRALSWLSGRITARPRVHHPTPARTLTREEPSRSALRALDAGRPASR